MVSFSNGQIVELAASYPRDRATDVPVSVAVSLRFNTALDPETLRHIGLFDEEDKEVEVSRSTDLTNASITISPREFLNPDSNFTLRGSAQVNAKDGSELQPFQITFRTGVKSFDPGNRLVFELETFDEARSMTTILFGPDRRLYAADAFGHLVRWEIDEAGRPVDKRTLLSDPRESRQYIDLEWDPDSTAERLILWVSFSERLAEQNERFYFTGTIARIEFTGQTHDPDIRERTLIRGLPHGRERQGGFDTLPHQPNGLVFRDGKLYQSVGSCSSSGGPPNWGVKEQLLSACILEIDYEQIDKPLDVHPGSGFDPFAIDSPVKIFATGVRNALEIVAHSNGRLYTSTNINDRAGPGDGAPDHPDIPGDQNQLVKDTTPDHESLFILERGRHYGFPNPVRKQYVLHGGNPTPGEDPFEIKGYPVGTQPDAGFAPELMFPIWQYGGTSANGMIEYLPAFEHPLRGSLLSCFYSANKIAAMQLAEDGLPVRVDELRSPRGKLPFTGPLDLTQDAESGIIYIADFGRQSTFGSDGSLKLLRPVFQTSRPIKNS